MKTSSILTWAWMATAVLLALMVRDYPGERGLQGVALGILALIQSFIVDLKIEELKKDIEYRG